MFCSVAVCLGLAAVGDDCHMKMGSSWGRGRPAELLCRMQAFLLEFRFEVGSVPDVNF